MNNLIDREQAIAALGTITMYKGMIPFNTAMERIKRMPSAELGTNLAEVGTDCISRQAVMCAIDEALTGKGCSTDGTMMARLINEFVIKKLPSAEPKRGEWILDRSGAYCCSKCMEPCAGYVMMKPRDKFCKMCGSRNEVTT